MDKLPSTFKDLFDEINTYCINKIYDADVIAILDRWLINKDECIEDSNTPNLIRDYLSKVLEEDIVILSGSLLYFHILILKKKFLQKYMELLI